MSEIVLGVGGVVFCGEQAPLALVPRRERRVALDAAQYSGEIEPPSVRHRGSGTANARLVGGDIGDVRHAMDDATSTIGDGVVAERLVHAFGSAWRDVWKLTGSDPTLVQRIAPDRPYVLAELRYGVVHEMARTLADLLVRRMPIAFETPDHGREAARRVAPRVAEWLEWSAAETEAALAAYDSDVARMFTID